MPTFDVKYGTYFNALPPRPIRMQPGGWGGAAEGMVDGSHPQPWHCLPFVEGSTYGIELLYPYETECHVVHDAGGVRFDFDYASEPGGVLSGGEFIFFNSAGPPEFYLFNTWLDIVAPQGHVVRTEPHPRYFTDRTNTVPLAMIGNVETEWYPRKMFVVFKVPPPGSRHVFRKGEPHAQLLFVPQRVSYRLSRLEPEEERARRGLERAIGATRSLVADAEWSDPEGKKFNNHYKVLARAFREGGVEGVRTTVERASEAQRDAMPKTVADCLAAGDALVRRNEFDDAKPIYAHVLALEPENATALRQLGICQACTGGPAAGLRLMARAAELEPRDADHRAALGLMLALLGRHAESEAAYRAALRLRPHDPALPVALAVALASQGKVDESLRACRASLSLRPTAQAHERLGAILAGAGRLAEARDAFNAALALDPHCEAAKEALLKLPFA